MSKMGEIAGKALQHAVNSTIKIEDLEKENAALKQTNGELLKTLRDVLSYPSEAPATSIAQADEVLKRAIGDRIKQARKK